MSELTVKVAIIMNGKKSMPKAFTIFGGSGDLTYRKLLPALYKIYRGSTDEDMFRIIAIGRRPYSTEDYVGIAKTWVKEFASDYSEEVFGKFAKHITYFQMDIENLEEYPKLQDFYVSNGITKHLFYFAVAPRIFMPITQGLRSFECVKGCKVVIEKPFGENLQAATDLYEMMADAFGKENLFHIDHYLGKEMIQSIQTIRFKNAIFQGIWNKDFIENVQISAFETVGVETRGGYYDDSGALKDMVQNHLFQVLSIIAMEQPNGTDFHEKQLAVLDSLRPIRSDELKNHVVLGQYQGYRQEPKVNPNSQTETYVALKLFVDQDRWEGVPFYIRTGKKLKKREMEVVIQFKKVDEDLEGNVLIIKIQPNEGIYFRFYTKKPGIANDIETVTMNFCQNCILENRINTPEAYERLLKASINGDHALFSQWDQIVTSWNYIDDVVEKLKQNHHPILTYEANTYGPEEADELLEQVGHYWFNSEVEGF